MFLLASCLLALLVSLVSLVLKRRLKEIETNSNGLLVITGCDSGIGLQLAQNLLETTNYTLICGVLQEESAGCRQLKGLVSVSNGRLSIINLDVTSDKMIETLRKRIDYDTSLRGSSKRLAAIINNAGVMAFGEFDWLTWDQIENQVQVNLLGTIRLTRALLPYIIEGHGRIVNISSVNDLTVFPGLTIYSATKSALSTFSRGLGYEMRKFGVHVVNLRLGDFARLTNIMSGHKDRKEAMWEKMDEPKRILYGDYFHQFHQHLLENFGMTSPKDFRGSRLFADTRRALLSPKPPNTITCAPLVFQVFYFVVELMPIWLQYSMLDVLLTRAFKWEPKNRDQSYR